MAEEKGPDQAREVSGGTFIKCKVAGLIEWKENEHSPTSSGFLPVHWETREGKHGRTVEVPVKNMDLSGLDYINDTKDNKLGPEDFPKTLDASLVYQTPHVGTLMACYPVKEHCVCLLEYFPEGKTWIPHKVKGVQAQELRRGVRDSDRVLWDVRVEDDDQMVDRKIEFSLMGRDLDLLQRCAKRADVEDMNRRVRKIVIRYLKEKYE